MSIHATTGAEASTAAAVERLTDAQLLQLDSLCASFAMEGMAIPAEGREAGARYLLGELTREQVVDVLDALGH